MICNSLNKPSTYCHTLKIQENNTETTDDYGDLWKNILLIIAIMVLFLIAAIFLYTRIIRKEINRQMSSEVNRMVEHYAAFGDKSDSKVYS